MIGVMFFTIRGVGTGVVFLDKHSTKRSTLKHVGQLDLTLPWWHGAWSSFRVERYTGLMHGMFCHIRDDGTVLMAARALHASTHNAKHDHVDSDARFFVYDDTNLHPCIQHSEASSTWPPETQ
ncbi:unnamed protein product [Cercospora beticola]|nr:unnamed protein product [Cercospora beticola]